MPPRLTNAPLIEGDQRSQEKIVLQNQDKQYRLLSHLFYLSWRKTEY